MAQPQDKVTRVAADLLDSAAAEGARNSRSAKQQLDHWARVGRAIDTHPTLSWRGIEAALIKNHPRETSDEERAVANAEAAARTQELLRTTDYGDTLRAEGVTIVGMDADGNIVQYLADGTTAPFEK